MEKIVDIITTVLCLIGRIAVKVIEVFFFAIVIALLLNFLSII